jgi:hypothetical protein
MLDAQGGEGAVAGASQDCQGDQRAVTPLYYRIGRH